MTNKSGYTGVALHRQTGRWHAYISVQGTVRSLGYFDTAAEASAAYQSAAAERAKLPKRPAPYKTRSLNQPAAKAARLIALMSLDEAGAVDTAQVATAWGVSRRTIQREVALLPRLRRELARLWALLGVVAPT